MNRINLTQLYIYISGTRRKQEQKSKCSAVEINEKKTKANNNVHKIKYF